MPRSPHRPRFEQAVTCGLRSCGSHPLRRTNTKPEVHDADTGRITRQSPEARGRGAAASRLRKARFRQKCLVRSGTPPAWPRLAVRSNDNPTWSIRRPIRRMPLQSSRTEPESSAWETSGRKPVAYCNESVTRNCMRWPAASGCGSFLRMTEPAHATQVEAIPFACCRRRSPGCASGSPVRRRNRSE